MNLKELQALRYPFDDYADDFEKGFEESIPESIRAKRSGAGVDIKKKKKICTEARSSQTTECAERGNSELADALGVGNDDNVDEALLDESLLYGIESVHNQGLSQDLSWGNEHCGVVNEQCLPIVNDGVVRPEQANLQYVRALLSDNGHELGGNIGDFRRMVPGLNVVIDKNLEKPPRDNGRYVYETSAESLLKVPGGLSEMHESFKGGAWRELINKRSLEELRRRLQQSGGESGVQVGMVRRQRARGGWKEFFYFYDTS